MGVQGCDWKPGSTPCPAGRSPHEARIATLKPARRWRLQPPTCPRTSRRDPREGPPRPGSFLGDWPPSPDRRGHVCAGSAPGTARGPASHTPAAADPSIRRRGPRRNRLVRADVTSHSRRGAPRLRGRAALGWAQRKEPPGGHSPRALPPLPPPLPPRWPPRLAARAAAPKRGGASARRRARSAPGRRLARGLRLPLLAAPATALGRPQPGASPRSRSPRVVTGRSTSRRCIGQGLLPSGQRMGVRWHEVSLREEPWELNWPPTKRQMRHPAHDCIHGAAADTLQLGLHSLPEIRAQCRPWAQTSGNESCAEGSLYPGPLAAEQGQASDHLAAPGLPPASPPEKVSAETATRQCMCVTRVGVTLLTRRAGLTAGASRSTPKSGVYAWAGSGEGDGDRSGEARFLGARLV